MNALRVVRDEESEWLASLWRTYGARLLAHVSRQVDSHTAQEIVAETFVITWRRREEVPEDPLPWLFVVAKNVLLNHVRASSRRRSREDEFERLHRLSEVQAGPEVGAVERDSVLAALRALSAGDREILLLVGWDGLSPAEGASVLGISVATFRARLARARRRLERATTHAEPVTRPAPNREPRTTPCQDLEEGLR